MKISVVIPTYNYGRYLGFALDSALAQLRPADEIIVVDDGSTDNTKDIVTPYLSRIRYIYQVNAGLSAARNTGTREASGDWVAYLDSDDAWRPEKLLRQQSAIEATPGAVLAYTGLISLFPDGRYGTPAAAPPPDRVWPRLRCCNLIPASSSMAKRSSVLEAGGFNEKLRSCEDWDLWVRLKRKGAFAAAVEPLTIVRQTPQSMSTNTSRMIANMEAIREDTLLDGLPGFSRRIWTHRIRAVAHMHAGLILADSSPAEERKHLLKSVAYWPSPWFEPKRYVALIRNLIGPAAYRRLSKAVRPFLPAA